MGMVPIDAGVDLLEGQCIGRYLVDGQLTAGAEATASGAHAGTIGGTADGLWYPSHFHKVNTFDAIVIGDDVNGGSSGSALTPPEYESLFISEIVGTDPPFNYIYKRQSDSMLQLWQGGGSGGGVFVGQSFQDPDGTPDPQYIYSYTYPGSGILQFPQLRPDDTTIKSGRQFNSILAVNATDLTQVWSIARLGVMDRPSATYINPVVNPYFVADSAELTASPVFSIYLRVEVWMSAGDINISRDLDLDFYVDFGFSEFVCTWDGVTGLFTFGEGQGSILNSSPSISFTPDWTGAQWQLGSFVTVKITRDSTTGTGIDNGPPLYIEGITLSL